MQQTADAELVELALPAEVLAQNQSAVGFQFIPQADGGDGFYYVKLVAVKVNFSLWRESNENNTVLGAGQVGSTLAANLVSEDNDITLVINIRTFGTFAG